MPYEAYGESADKLVITKEALAGLFRILEEQQVPPDDLDAKLREISAVHKELLARLATVQSQNVQVVKLKQEAGQAVEEGRYAEAGKLLGQVEDRDLGAIEELEQTARQRRISAAETCAEQADLQRVQLRYAAAAEYWRKAADLLPEDRKLDRAYYLNEAGYDLHRMTRYSDALRLYEQSLAISREIGDTAREAVMNWNIGRFYQDQGDLAKAEQHMTRSVEIMEAVGHPSLEQCRKVLEEL
jgi:tetratricopeptide (TPR) repeat protein